MFTKNNQLTQNLALIVTNCNIFLYFQVWIFFGHLMITIGSAFCATMLVEAPFIALEKIILRGFVGKESNAANNHAPMPSESTTPKSIRSDEIHEPVSHL